MIWVGFVIPLLMHRRPTFDFARIVFLTVSYLVAVCLGLFAWVVTGIFAPSILGRCIGTAVVAGLWLIPVVRISRLLSRIKQREAERLAVQRQAITTQTTTVVPRRRQIPVFLDAGHTAERTGQDELDDLELGERVRFHLDSWQVIAHSYPEPNERLRAIITVLTRALEGR